MPEHEENQLKKNRTRPAASCVVVSSALFFLLIALCGLLFHTKMVPLPYVCVGAALSAALTGLVFFLTWDKARRVRRTIGFLLAALMLPLCIGAGFFICRSVSAVREMTDTAVELSKVSFYAEKDSSVETLEDLAGHPLGILAELDRDTTDEALRFAKTEHDLSFSTVEYEGLTQLADALRTGEVSGIALNQALLPLYEELSGYETFPQELLELAAQETEHVMEHVSTPEQEPPEPSQPLADEQVLTILISGSDTRGSTIDRRGRSDVNIIARINWETHKILLVSTPRDYYVPLALSSGNYYDKLTHAGIYGMDVLMGTLENLYGIQIDYCFRLNFTGFTRIIDALGGVEVYSEYDFSTGDYHYQKGMNYLNGEEALAFARERYAFSEGDRQRGKNQMAVIKGALQKAMSPSILTGYLSILESVQDCVDTSIPYDLIAAAVRRQLTENAQWEVESYSVNGTGAWASTYSMSQKLYVMMPNEATVQEAKEKLDALARSNQ